MLRPPSDGLRLAGWWSRYAAAAPGRLGDIYCSYSTGGDAASTSAKCHKKRLGAAASGAPAAEAPAAEKPKPAAKRATAATTTASERRVRPPGADAEADRAQLAAARAGYRRAIDDFADDAAAAAAHAADGRPSTAVTAARPPYLAGRCITAPRSASAATLHEALIPVQTSGRRNEPRAAGAEHFGMSPINGPLPVGRENMGPRESQVPRVGSNRHLRWDANTLERCADLSSLAPPSDLCRARSRARSRGSPAAAPRASWTDTAWVGPSSGGTTPAPRAMRRTRPTSGPCSPRRRRWSGRRPRWSAMLPCSSTALSRCARARRPK